MRATVILRPDITIAQYGYDPSTLLNGSCKFVMVECTECHTIVRRQSRYATKRHQCPIVVGTKKKCHRCGEWKDLTLFNKNGKLSGGVAKMCKKCYNTHPAIKKLEKSRSARLKVAIKDGDYKYYICRRIPRLISRARRDGMQCDIDSEFMVKLWENQKGKCYYTGIAMVGCGTDKGLPEWNSPSVDKKDPSLGYIKNNVVWCINSVNSFKGGMTDIEFEIVVKQVEWWFTNTGLR